MCINEFYDWYFFIFFINKKLAGGTLLINPYTLYILQFYATATFQIQYIIPQFLGNYITDLPFTLKWLNGKKFIA